MKNNLLLLDVDVEIIINLIFQVILNRKPSIFEVDNYLTKFQSIQDIKFILQDIIQSQEFYDQVLIQHADKLLDSVYQGILQRRVDQSGLKNYRQVLIEGNLEDVIRSLLRSNEFRENQHLLSLIFGVDNISEYHKLLPHIIKQNLTVLSARQIFYQNQLLKYKSQKLKDGDPCFLFIYRDKKEFDSLEPVFKALNHKDIFRDRIYMMSLEQALCFSTLHANYNLIYVISIAIISDILRFVGLNHPIVYMEHGVAPLKRYTYAPHYKMYNYSLLPGELWVTRIQKLYPELLNRVFDVGYPKLNIDLLSYDRKTEYCKIMGFDDRLPIVLFAPTYSANVKGAGIYNIQYFYNMEDVNICVVPHDGDKSLIDNFILSCPKNVIFYDGDKSISYHYNFADILVSDISSTAIEFARLGKPVICLNTGIFSDYDYNYLDDNDIPKIPHTDKKWNFCPLVSAEELPNKIRKIIFENDYFIDSNFVEQMCSCYGDESIERMINIFEKIMGDCSKQFSNFCNE